MRCIYPECCAPRIITTWTAWPLSRRFFYRRNEVVSLCFRVLHGTWRTHSTNHWLFFPYETILKTWILSFIRLRCCECVITSMIHNNTLIHLLDTLVSRRGYSWYYRKPLGFPLHPSPLSVLRYTSIEACNLSSKDGNDTYCLGVILKLMG